MSEAVRVLIADQMDPRAEAAGTSIVSTPIPARPMTFRRGSAASMIGAVILVELRTATPS
jgi:hypothetical protein